MGFIELCGPGRKDGLGFVAKELLHGDATGGGSAGKLLVDKGVVETGAGGIGGGRGIKNAGHTGPIRAPRHMGQGSHVQ